MQRKKPESHFSKDKNISSLKIGIVVSTYNSDITFPMRDGAIETLKKAGIQLKNILAVEAPGAFEIPFACQKIIKKYKLSGVVAVGCVIKGDTDHYHFIAGETTRGIMDVMLKTNTPISNAVLTVNTLAQAKVRSKGEMNKGVEATCALIEVLKL
jgi:6,7-dimethyl-8-ribityllumazine synthase